MIEHLRSILYKHGIAEDRIPALVTEIAEAIKADLDIADSMRDYWKHTADGAA